MSSGSSNKKSNKERHKHQINKILFGPLKKYIDEDPDLTGLQEFLKLKEIDQDFSVSRYTELLSLLEVAKKDNLGTSGIITELQEQLIEAQKEIRLLKARLASNNNSRNKTIQKRKYPNLSPIPDTHNTQSRLNLRSLSPISPPVHTTFTVTADVHIPASSNSTQESVQLDKYSSQTFIPIRSAPNKKKVLILDSSSSSPSPSPPPTSRAATTSNLIATATNSPLEILHPASQYSTQSSANKKKRLLIHHSPSASPETLIINSPSTQSSPIQQITSTATQSPDIFNLHSHSPSSQLTNNSAPTSSTSLYHSPLSPFQPAVQPINKCNATKALRENFYLTNTEIEGLSKHIERYRQLDSVKLTPPNNKSEEKSYQHKRYLTDKLRNLHDPTLSNNPDPATLALFHIFRKGIYAPLDKYKHIKDISIEQSELLIANLSDQQTRIVGGKIRQYKRRQDNNCILYNLSHAIEERLQKVQQRTAKNKTRKLNQNTRKSFSKPTTASTDEHLYSSDSTDSE